MAGTEPAQRTLAVALLAAGRSARFGESDKLAAELGGRPLIDWAAEAGKSIHAAQHFVVISAGAGLGELPAGYVPLVNADAGEGLGSSLRLAARHARESGASALLVLLGDMPLVTTRHLAGLLAAFAQDDARPLFSGAPGGLPQPPALFPAALFPALAALGGDSGARALAQGARLVEASADELIDVDTPADLARCAGLIAAGEGLSAGG